MASPQCRALCASTVILLLPALGAGSAFAQSVSSSPPAPKASDVVTLTPFEVDASRDVGYRAASTLAGSRLNTDLKDIASVIDVYTRDFLDDLGATDLESILGYANNLEKDTEDSTHGEANVMISTNPTFAYRIRGLPASRARNYFNFDYLIDAYNVERLDESRGPNAILFGFGAPGGIVNTSTKRAQTGRSFQSLEITAGNEIDHRVSLDINQVLLKGRAALRVNGLHQEKEGWRAYTFDDKRAAHVAATLLPLPRTKISLEYENFWNHDRTSRPGTYWSQTKAWEAAGRPLVNGNFAARTNPTLNPGLNPASIGQLSNTTYWVYTEESGEVANWRGMSRSNTTTYTAPDGTVYNGFANFRAMEVQPEGIVEVNVLGPGEGRHHTLEVLYASVDQQLADRLNLEVAAMSQSSRWSAKRMASSTLFADVNASLPAGGPASTGPTAANPRPNPFAGQYYFENFSQFWITDADSEDLRAALSYDLDLGRRFGRHRIGALWETSRYTVRTQSLQEMLLVNGALTTTLPNNPQNRLVRRHYITNPSNPLDYRQTDVSRLEAPMDIRLPDGTRLTSSWVQYTTDPADYIKRQTAGMAVLQSRWWNDCIHTTVGLRRDVAKFDDWSTYMPDGAGALVRNPANREFVRFTSKTHNYGMVYHFTPALSVYGNVARSAGLPGRKVAYVPEGQFMDPMEGKGRDYGIKFAIPHSSIAGSLGYYESSSNNEPDNLAVGDWAVGGSNAILDALVTARLMTADQTAPLRSRGNGDTVDSRTKGFEFSVGGQITTGWNIRANYSYTEKVLSNPFPRVEAWAAATLRPFWQSLSRDNPATPAADNILDTVLSGNQSLRDIIENFESNLQERGVTRLRVTGLRPHKLNLFTSYTFARGGLKGLRIGGGLRYSSPNWTGQDRQRRETKGISHTSADFMAAYGRELWGRRWSLQANINHAFQSDAKAGPAVLTPAGTWNSIIVFPPREILLTLRVKM
jgi:iron complex outermembrane recepter protein